MIGSQADCVHERIFVKDEALEKYEPRRYSKAVMTSGALISDTLQGRKVLRALESIGIDCYGICVKL